MKSYDYETTLKLKHNEVAAIQNIETGEYIVQVPKTFYKSKEIDFDSVRVLPKETFTKNFKKSWEFLYFRLTPIQYKVAHFLSNKVAINSNSLKPYNDASTMRFLASEFGISLGSVQMILDKLLRAGVYGKFEVYEVNKEYTKYWIFNPYLGYNGKYLPVGIMELFKNTEIAKIFLSANELD